MVFGGSAEGQQLAMAIAQLLGVTVQLFKQTQVFAVFGLPVPGIEGETLHCGPRACLEVEPSEFIKTIYVGDGTEGGATYGNKEPGWG